MENLFNDKDLKGIAITVEGTNELLAYIPNGDLEMIQRKDVWVRMNYGKEYKFKNEDGKVYIVEE